MSSGILIPFKNKNPNDKAGVRVYTAFCSLQGSEEANCQVSLACDK